MSLQFGGPLADGGSAGEATFNLADYVMPFILSGLPSAVTGGGAAYVLNTFGMWE